MKIKTFTSILSSAILLFGDGAHGQSAMPQNAAAPPANPYETPVQPANPYEIESKDGDRIAPVGEEKPPPEDSPAAEAVEEHHEDVQEEKNPEEANDIAKEDPTGVMPAQADQDDPQWFKNNMKIIPCFKLAEEGLYDLGTLKNMDGDWTGRDKFENTVYFNFCHYTEMVYCEDHDGDNFGYMVTKNGGCSTLTSDTPSAEVVEASERASLTDPDETQDGIRISRAGGSECPEDALQSLSLTIDIWCNPSYGQMPQDVEILDKIDGYETEDCNIYVSMEHADGCIFWDMRPFLKVLGVTMIVAGVFLMILGVKIQKMFMRLLIRIAVLVACIGLFYMLNFFDKVDPSAVSKKGAGEAYTLAILAIIISFYFQYMAGIAFRKALKFGPTLIGGITGYWFSIYFIMYLNGFMGFFANVGAKDFISPLWCRIIEIIFVMFGSWFGYRYSLLFMLLIQTFISSYLIMRGCTLISNWGYPNEFVMMQAATSETNGVIHLGFMFYFYMLALLIMWIFSFKYQWESTTQDDEERYLENDSD